MKTSTLDVNQDQGFCNQGSVDAGVTVAAAPNGFCRPRPVWTKVSTLWRGRDHALQEFFLNTSLQTVCKKPTRIVFNWHIPDSDLHFLLPEARRREDGEQADSESPFTTQLAVICRHGHGQARVFTKAKTCAKAGTMVLCFLTPLIEHHTLATSRGDVRH